MLIRRKVQGWIKRTKSDPPGVPWIHRPVGEVLWETFPFKHV
nr:MAG TPA: hypothetical protein [Caudoviricetes sp.]